MLNLDSNGNFYAANFPLDALRLMTAKQPDLPNFVRFPRRHRYDALNEFFPFNPQIREGGPPGYAPFEWEGHLKVEESQSVGSAASPRASRIWSHAQREGSVQSLVPEDTKMSRTRQQTILRHQGSAPSPDPGDTGRGQCTDPSPWGHCTPHCIGHPPRLHARTHCRSRRSCKQARSCGDSSKK